VADTSAIAAALAPGVALTSAVIYWANLQSRLDFISTRVRNLNAELRGETKGSVRAKSVERQIGMLIRRSRVLHAAVVLSAIALIGFLGSSAMLFLSVGRFRAVTIIATTLFMLGLASLGSSMLSMAWEMLWSRHSLEEDVSSSRPRDT
jgi:hypothetical protein